MAGDAEDEIFDLSKLLSSQGYDCLVESIFSKLDPITLAKCRLVSKAWKVLIDNRRSLLVIQLQTLRQKTLKHNDADLLDSFGRVLQSKTQCSITELFPEFNEAFLSLERNANANELKIVVAAIKDYTKDGTFPIGALYRNYGARDRRLHTQNHYSDHYDHYADSGRTIPRSPLHQAIVNADQEFIKMLMKSTKFDFQSSPNHGADILMPTYLSLAAPNEAIVQLFLSYAQEKRINLNLPDGFGRHAFQYACWKGSLGQIIWYRTNDRSYSILECILL